MDVTFFDYTNEKFTIDIKWSHGHIKKATIVKTKQGHMNKNNIRPH